MIDFGFDKIALISATAPISAILSSAPRSCRAWRAPWAT